MANREIVLVTGSGGYLGGAIVRKLAGKYTIVGFDRPDGKAPPECAKRIGLDLGCARTSVHQPRTGQMARRVAVFGSAINNDRNRGKPGDGGVDRCAQPASRPAK